MKALIRIFVILTLAFGLMAFISNAGLSHEMSEKEYNEYLLKALKDENVGIRSSAAQLLGERKVLQAVKPLTNMLKNEEHYAVRIMAALALYQIGGEDVLKVFKQQVKRDRNKTVRNVLAGLIQTMENVQYAKK